MLFFHQGFNILVEENAGALASFRNQDYEAAGAKVVPRKDAFESGKKYLSLIGNIFITLLKTIYVNYAFLKLFKGKV